MNEEVLAAILAGSKPSATKESSFTNYTVYINEVYVGNFSLPHNMTEATQATVLKAMEMKGLQLLAPGSNKKDISLADLGL